MNNQPQNKDTSQSLEEKLLKELFWITRGTLEMAKNIWLNSDTDDQISEIFGKLDEQYYYNKFGEDDGSYRTRESFEELKALIASQVAESYKKGYMDGSIAEIKADRLAKLRKEETDG